MSNPKEHKQIPTEPFSRLLWGYMRKYVFVHLQNKYPPA